MAQNRPGSFHRHAERDALAVSIDHSLAVSREEKVLSLKLASENLCSFFGNADEMEFSSA